MNSKQILDDMVKENSISYFNDNAFTFRDPQDRMKDTIDRIRSVYKCSKQTAEKVALVLKTTYK